MRAAAGEWDRSGGGGDRPCPSSPFARGAPAPATVDRADPGCILPGDGGRRCGAGPGRGRLLGPGAALRSAGPAAARRRGPPSLPAPDRPRRHRRGRPEAAHEAGPPRSRRAAPPRPAEAERADREGGISTFWHGLVAADAEGRTLTPLVLWPDPRSWRAAEDLARRLDPETVRRRTGCTLHASYWPASLVWSKEARPDLWRRPVRWMGFGALLCWRLFGRPGTSLSMASGTGLP